MAVKGLKVKLLSIVTPNGTLELVDFISIISYDLICKRYVTKWYLFSLGETPFSIIILTMKSAISEELGLYENVRNTVIHVHNPHIL